MLAARSHPADGGQLTVDEQPAGLLILGVSDREAAQEALPRLRGDGEWVSQEHRGSTIWSTDDRAEQPSAYVLLDDVLILASSVDELREALDVGSGDQPSLLSEARFADPWRALPAGRLIAFWMDAKAFGEPPAELPLASLPIDPFSGACADQLPQPETTSGAVFVRSGRAHVDVTTTYAEGAELPANGDSRLARRLPADTFFYAEHRQLGDAADRWSECLAQGGADAEELAELEELLGPLDDLLGWAGDGALAARWDGANVGLGAVVAVDDRQAAENALAELRTKLTDGEHGAVTISETTHAGVTVVEAILEDEGIDEEAPAAAPGRVLSWALTDDIVVFGMDGSFTRAVLDTTAVGSLSDSEGFRQAVEAVGGTNGTGILYLDMQAAMAVAEALELGSDQGDEELLRALDSIVAVSRLHGRSIVTQLVVIPAE